MLKTQPLVILVDVDNTLLDNDRFVDDLSAHLVRAFGRAQSERYWQAFDALRSQFGYADYLGALQRLREGCDNQAELLRMSAFLLDYPFRSRLYPGALDTLEHLCGLGRTVLLSDGDMVFQPRKVQRSGLWEAVDGQALIFVHKERMLAAVQRHFPAVHYVMIDDKPLLLASMKRAMGPRLTSLFVRQGHYAAEANTRRITPAPDIGVECIGDVRALRQSDLVNAGANALPTCEAIP
ncbi:HAD family hydrolase [Pseudomonas sp. 30_B]|uniref:HAD family hydrolase n=1 Tax=Pseudomonas sp. 30_B TaxID=2813575 RepID=UPI001A9D74ED|nr:HAD family hydrolase [Pseudomonas sp. 30_B]